MRKLTVLLLSGALLAITGGASVARAEDFALVLCARHGTDIQVVASNANFQLPRSTCRNFASCSECLAAITGRGLNLVDTIVMGDILMIFSTQKGVLKR